jgi:hypothetical protein
LFNGLYFTVILETQVPNYLINDFFCLDYGNHLVMMMMHLVLACVALE